MAGNKHKRKMVGGKGAMRLNSVVAYLIRLLLRGSKPGAARQPLTFFASPKKVSKERRRKATALPLGGSPNEPPGIREGKQTRCAQTSFPS